MIDAEVMRLRRLRGTALRVRALAIALESSDSHNSVISRSAVTCWRIARMITGRLRGHPDLSYQRGPGELRALLDRINAGVRGTAARSRNRTFEVLAGEMRGVGRELDDARALTMSSELSDDWGRLQIEVRRLIAELGGGPRQDTESRALARERDSIPEAEGDVGGNWPYLAF
ncbi:MAG: hypothetical protein WA803_22440 [Steroidobacteraceae bacterium]